MMKLILIISALFIHSTFSSIETKQNVTPKDKEILLDLFSQLENKADYTTSELVVLAGKSFLETPYVAHTIECNEEQLVVNLREMDCTTYAENCLAIARTIKSRELTYTQFTKELTNIRYHKGVVNEYPSRLHYFSDWIFENAEKGLVKQVSKEMGSTPYVSEINFMSTHPDSYEQLKNNPDFISRIAETEKDINTRSMFYIPKDKIAEYEHLMKEGDIIGITTSIKGLDIMHVAILVKKDNRIHLMHASSAADKVVISEETLVAYLSKSKSASGIMIVRPL